MDNKDLKLYDRVLEHTRGVIGTLVEITDTDYIFQYKKIDFVTGKRVRRPLSIEKYNQLVAEGSVTKIIDTLTGSILQGYIDYIEEHKCGHVRVIIEEDKAYGIAIVEAENGTPCSIEYDIAQGWH